MRYGTGRAIMPVMRMRRAAVLLSFALVAACSSESSDDGLNPQPLPPEEEGARAPNAGTGTTGDSSEFGPGTCSSDKLPTEGSPCEPTADTTCSWAVTCPTGLVIPYEVTCTDGVWKLTNGCPAGGESDSRGCPASQPQDGAPCTQTATSSQCGYVLQCTGYRKSATAQCIRQSAAGATWSTDALGACD